MSRFLAVAILALAIAGCDQKALEKNFNASFDKSTHDGCIKTASGRDTPQAVEGYCTCVVAQLDKYSVQEKMKLNQEPDKLRAAAAACQPGATNATS
ncbi:MAG TPA: hypothetical protein VGF50_12660 [Caulobacteraceae bacterium]